MWVCTMMFFKWNNSSEIFFVICSDVHRPMYNTYNMQATLAKLKQAPAAILGDKNCNWPFKDQRFWYLYG